MDRYRVEIRIFGLLVFALISTLALAWGLEAGDVQGEVAGISFQIVGPAAFFVVLILVFFAVGLFRFGLLEGEDTDILNGPLEELSLADVERLLDEVLMRSRRIDRRKRQLEAAREALQRDASTEAVMDAVGMRAARRTGGAGP